MAERHSICVDRDLHNQIVDKIQMGASVHLYDQSLRVKIKGVQINGEWIVVVYDKMRKTAVTTLPKESEFYQDPRMQHDHYKSDSNHL